MLINVRTTLVLILPEQDIYIYVYIYTLKLPIYGNLSPFQVSVKLYFNPTAHLLLIVEVVLEATLSFTHETSFASKKRRKELPCVIPM